MPKDGFWVDDHTFMPREVYEKGLRDAEGKELPLKDRPGGRVIGTATVHEGQFHMTIDDPDMKELLTGTMPMTGLSIYSPPEERVWAISPGAQEVVDRMLKFPLKASDLGMVDPSEVK